MHVVARTWERVACKNIATPAETRERAKPTTPANLVYSIGSPLRVRNDVEVEGVVGVFGMLDVNIFKGTSPTSN
ncbi:MAG: hypothetical protein UW68_C0003G0038 [Candidatus Collierbacteria bacterium GW2011_GWB1_44_6]|uniref:Uncharacterized protein n=1 Tax=Candidatus Collierbacteria bacterium GW2011_GWB1_44_6 TaxID=1618384 RepID=A0A0G1LY11_9BACT|nr:MAG: hypothetical protein UW68_C0003G0038 [Candidatus Collierbacteria bacterium GW2011_GWB1_44_6]